MYVKATCHCYCATSWSPDLVTSKHPFCENDFFLLLWIATLKNVDIAHRSQPAQPATYGSGAMLAMPGTMLTVLALTLRNATGSSSTIVQNAPRAMDHRLVIWLDCWYSLSSYSPLYTWVDKANVRKSQRERVRLNYADLNNGKTADQEIWKRILNAHTFVKDPFKRYHGSQVTLELLRKTGMREPFVIESPDGLDMQMPSQSITVNDIADAIGTGIRVL